MATNNTDVNSMLKVGTVLRGVYRIDDYLASGGFGNTYLATNLEFDEHVAIKEFYMKGVSLRNEDSSVSVSHPENVEMFDKLLKTFKREAKRLWKLSMGNAPHVVKVFDLFEENNTSYYVMQHINGRSLSGVLKANNKPLDEAWLMNSLLPQMLEALDAIHKNSMWHLDIKPSNIMIDDKGNAYLIDFGSSKQLDTSSGVSTLSSTLSFTKNFAPLELLQFEYKKIGPWSDIYSLGATLYNLATNLNPPSAYDILNEGDNAFKFKYGTRDDLKHLVIWMMKTTASNRPHSVSEIYSFINKSKNKKILPESLLEQNHNISEETLIMSSNAFKVPVIPDISEVPDVPAPDISEVPDVPAPDISEVPEIPLSHESTVYQVKPEQAALALQVQQATAMPAQAPMAVTGEKRKGLWLVIGIIVGIFTLAVIGRAAYHLLSKDDSIRKQQTENVADDIGEIPGKNIPTAVPYTSRGYETYETDNGASTDNQTYQSGVNKTVANKPAVPKHDQKPAQGQQIPAQTQKPQNNTPLPSTQQGRNAYERLHGNGGQQQQQSRPSQSQQQKGRNAYEKIRQQGQKAM